MKTLSPREEIKDAIRRRMLTASAVRSLPPPAVAD